MKLDLLELASAGLLYSVVEVIYTVTGRMNKGGFVTLQGSRDTKFLGGKKWVLSPGVQKVWQWVRAAFGP